MQTSIKGCTTCRFAFTHEPVCDNCLNTPEDYAQYRQTGKMPEMRYAGYIEAAGPDEQLNRLHRLQLDGARCITLGPGEADVYATSSPEETSQNLHHVAEQCGYFCHNLKRENNITRLTIQKDYGPFTIEWESGRLMRIWRGDSKPAIFWER